MPFPIQRIQSDRGLEFFAVKVQQWLMHYSIKFRPIKPRSPHLSGKIERSHKTDLIEFYSLHNIGDPQLGELLAEWQYFYNWHRPHSSLGAPPMKNVLRCRKKLPIGMKLKVSISKKKKGFRSKTTD